MPTITLTKVLTLPDIQNKQGKYLFIIFADYDLSLSYLSVLLPKGQ